MADDYFGAEEAEAILKRAASRQSHTGATVSRERLLAMAAELDIAPEDVEAAIAESQDEREDAELRKAFIASRRGSIMQHLAPFLSVNLMLIVIWFLSGHGHPWFLYPLMGWGIGMVSHIVAVWPNSGPEFEAGLAEYKKKHARREQARTRRATKRAEKQAEKVETTTVKADTASTVYNTQPTQDESKANILRAGQ